MPLFMDLHIVPGITAQGVAEAHVLDLKIQEEYKCSCMTYWIDEANNSAFCLIEAPNANAVRELHNKAHGLLPFNIIEVNKDAVKSFLGRLYDPEIPGIPREELKVFNDPAYRCMVFIEIKDPVFLKLHTSLKRSQALLFHFHQIIKEYSDHFSGEIAEDTGAANSLLCFSYSENAVKCAVEIINAFTHEEKDMLGIRISINAGMPVTSNHRIFGETIDLGEFLLHTSNDHNIVLASGVKDIALKYFKDQGMKKIITHSPAEEKFLKKIFIILKQYSPDENFGIEKLCSLAGLSKSSLNRHLQNLTSKSPNSLLKEFRLNHALKLLRAGENISNIAFNTGFRSPSYFSKCFKQHFHLSPSDYIEHLKIGSL